MAIIVSADQRQFSLQTEHSLYQIVADSHNYLLHAYYGSLITAPDFTGFIQYRNRDFSPQTADVSADRAISCDSLPLEFPAVGNGDFKQTCLATRTASGQRGCDLRYQSYTISAGCPHLSQLPCLNSAGPNCQTLAITLADPSVSLAVRLYYFVCPEYDIIARHAVIINESRTQTVQLNRADSMALDLLNGPSFDLITLPGRWARERQYQRQPATHGCFSMTSRRGASSAQYNPFMAVCTHNADENSGGCYGIMLVYSGNFEMTAEIDQTEMLRVTAGIGSSDFIWTLKPGQCFETPQVIMTYTPDGLGQMSRQLHDIIRLALAPAEFRTRTRPVLLNSWEACYFDINEEKILNLASQAADLGMDMLVMDDGWFGCRKNDHSSLGDWTVSPAKFKNGLGSLIQKVKALGLQFGLWVEPEMISPDSDLYRLHPDWALTVENRAPLTSRFQYVLDMSRPPVSQYVYDTLYGLLVNNEISYLKWDMNRNIADLPAGELSEQPQAVMHCYMLAVYDILARLRQTFPNVLIEGCAGGGGRYDAGMMAYCPQIWCSDDTDPLMRLSIQYGSSLAYPASVMSCHVSVSPNHQTGRSTPLPTRFITAAAGMLGYELDPQNLSADDKTSIRRQIQRYKEISPLLLEGDLYRLSGQPEKDGYYAWMYVSKNKKQAVASVVFTDVQPNAPVVYLHLDGLRADSRYTVEQFNIKATGSQLKLAGLPLPAISGDYPAFQFKISQTD